MYMVFDLLLALSSPMTWLIAIMVISSWRNHRQRQQAGKGGISSRSTSVPAIGAANALQFFSLAYRPDHAFVAKAQITQEEEADEDDDGSPDTPVKHLQRQLRRIRRGQYVDRLIWRLE